MNDSTAPVNGATHTAPGGGAGDGLYGAAGHDGGGNSGPDTSGVNTDVTGYLEPVSDGAVYGMEESSSPNAWGNFHAHEDDEKEGDDDNDDDNEFSGIPIDEGWAYMVVVACFGMHFLVVGMVKSFGVLYLELQEKYDASASQLSVIQGMAITFMFALGVVAKILTEKFTTRVIVFIGGILCGLGLILSAFVPRVEWLYVTYCLITGVGCALAYSPCIVMVGQHFRKYRSFANGVSVAGSGVGTFALPNLMRLVLKEYGLSGCFLLLGAITLNVSVLALLLRPLSSYSPRRKNRSKQSAETTTLELTTKVNGINGKVSASLITRDHEKSVTTSSCNGNHGGDRHDDVITSVAYPAEETEMELLGRGGVEERSGVLELGDSKKENQIEDRSREEAISLSTSQVSLQKWSESTTNSPYNHESERRKDSFARNDQSGGRGDVILPLLQNNPQADIQKTSSNTCICCTNSICFKKHKSSAQPQKRPLFDWSLLKNPLFLIYSLSCLFANLGYGNVFFILPDYAQKVGQSRDMAALLVSMIGITDTVGRVFFGWFSDREFFPKRFGYIACMAFSGVLNLIAPFVTSFAGLAVYANLYGLTAGSFIALIAVMLADTLGTERLGSSFSLTTLAISFSLLVAPPICGALKDETHSWTAAFIFSGVAAVVGSIFPLFEPCALKWVKDHGG